MDMFFKGDEMIEKIRETVTFYKREFWCILLALCIAVSTITFPLGLRLGRDASQSVTSNTLEVCGIDGYEGLMFKRADETTGDFFLRVKYSMACIKKNGYTVYAFTPLFAVDSPVVVGAKISFYMEEKNVQNNNNL